MPTLATPRKFHGNVAEMLWHAADATPERYAILDGPRRVTFAALRHRAAAIARSLALRDVVPGDRVAILLDRGPEAAASIFGVFASGAVCVCINERLRPRQIEHLLRHSGARVLLTTDEMLARQPRALEADATVLRLADVGAATSGGRPVPRAPSDIAQIIYTSGSTGLPKGVAMSHASIGAAIAIVSGYLQLRGDDRIASLIGFSSVYGLNQLLCAMHNGATLVIETSPLPAAIASTLREHAVSVVAAVPPLWSQLLTAPDVVQPLPALRVMQNAGGHLPPVVARRLRTVQPHAQLFLQYGMTETFRSTYLPPEEVDAHPDSMGRAMPETEILVVREDLTPCEPGEVGELVHRGPTIASGYWNDLPATERVFRPNPFGACADDASERVVFSGDLVRRDASGLLYYVARRDRLIKTLGFRVGPDEIADVLFASGQINECVVTAEPDTLRGDRIVAHVVLSDAGTVEQLVAYSRRELPRHMQPARITALESLPRLAGGKYDVAALRGPAMLV